MISEYQGWKKIWMVFPERNNDSRLPNYYPILIQLIEKNISHNIKIIESYDETIKEIENSDLPDCILIDGLTEVYFVNQLTRLVYMLREKNIHLPLVLISTKEILLEIPVPILTKFDGYILKENPDFNVALTKIKESLLTGAYREKQMEVSV